MRRWTREVNMRTGERWAVNRLNTGKTHTV